MHKAYDLCYRIRYQIGIFGYDSLWIEGCVGFICEAIDPMHSPFGVIKLIHMPH